MNTQVQSESMTPTATRPLSRYKRWLIPLTLLALTAAAFAYLKAHQNTPVKASKTEKSWPVNTLRIQPETAVPQVDLLGVVEAPYSSVLSAAVAADVVKSLALEGAQVREGELLLQLDDREIALLLAQREADVADLQARIQSEMVRHQANLAAMEGQRTLLSLAEKAVSREQQLSQSNVSSASKIDLARQQLETTRLSVVAKQLDVEDHPNRLAQLKAQLARAEANLAQTRLDVKRTRILAPFDATITQVYVSPGERVRSGDRLIELYDRQKTEIRAQIPQRWVDDLAAAHARGQQLTATASSASGPVSLTLDRLSGEVNSGTGGVDGLFRLTEQATGLVRGKTLHLTLNLPAVENVYRLPLSALYGTDRIYRLKDERLESISITLMGRNMLNDRQYLLFTSGELKSEDEIITTQLPNAINGLKVRINNATPKEATQNAQG